MTLAEPLTAIQRGILLFILSRHAPGIEQVFLYGSRARGDHRPGSDIDLAIDGSMTDAELAALKGELDESDLSVFVDAHLLHDVRDQNFARAVAKEAVPLFSRHDLIAAR